MDCGRNGRWWEIGWWWKSVRPTVYRITFFIMENSVDILYDKLLRDSATFCELNCVLERIEEISTFYFNILTCWETCVASESCCRPIELHAHISSQVHNETLYPDIPNLSKRAKRWIIKNKLFLLVFEADNGSFQYSLTNKKKN